MNRHPWRGMLASLVATDDTITDHAGWQHSVHRCQFAAARRASMRRSLDLDGLARQLARAVELGYLPSVIAWLVLRDAKRGVPS